ncbi:glycine/D-amino acid oxidase-like deaminating enzyme [Ectopseudomonas oleovorans]|uniref:Glycine/D-amino acid oxidase-like deaminating enzyme n=1 Tax=Ectopseudomonas oleovorans TaxID=301 RepID=A0A397NDX8_ECTOL|nr:FAD-dependent oxidoreductase [Pseudomonas oleovorans]RIA31911.1 glycine/D-amino acid oxidase-like deaminating enzyme [Pseudomonas oleovorans]
MTHRALTSLKHAIPQPYWLDAEGPPPGFTRHAGELHCDLAIVGGGFTGLWTALLARQRHPDKRIVLLEANACGGAASGRNGGFCAPSISHGVSNALKRWPQEAEALIRLGRQNLDALQRDIERLGLNVEFERQGKLNVATTPWQVDGLKAMQEKYRRFGIDCQYLEGDALKARLDSPNYVAGLFESNYALLNPVKMVRELRRACLEQDIEVYEHSPVRQLVEHVDSIRLETDYGVVVTERLALATNIFTSLLPRLTSKVIPIYDYALTTEPLSDEQLSSIGWQGRYGIADSGNQFHYWRKTADNRILWGGYDAVYPFASKLDEGLTQRPETFIRLAEQFLDTFPQLGDISFSHAWGGIIDSSARTTMFTGSASQGRIAYALGFTGQGVSASRFAAATMLDLLAGEKTERTALKMLSRAPVMFPPEPIRYSAVTLAQRGLEQEDRTGRRNLLLRTMDAFGVGFDS